MNAASQQNWLQLLLHSPAAQVATLALNSIFYTREQEMQITNFCTHSNTTSTIKAGEWKDKIGPEKISVKQNKTLLLIGCRTCESRHNAQWNVSLTLKCNTSSLSKTGFKLQRHDISQDNSRTSPYRPHFMNTRNHLSQEDQLPASSKYLVFETTSTLKHGLHTEVWLYILFIRNVPSERLQCLFLISIHNT